MSSGSPGSTADTVRSDHHGGVPLRASGDNMVCSDGFEPMELSVVIPIKNEAENIAPLVGEIRAALDGLLDYEMLFIDDGSSDASAAEVLRLAAGMPRLRLLRHAQSCGQSAAIRTGVRAARAGWIATLDGDGQNDPADIPNLWHHRLADSEAASILINGTREKRRDNWSKRFASRIANAIRGRLLGDHTADTGCGLKLFPRALFLDLPYFDHMHRFLPALVLREGGTVHSVRVNHRARRGGVSKYGVFDRLGVGIVDLFGVIWLKHRGARPLLLEKAAAEAKPSPAAAMPR
jgi:dolichol-phosphate mannosyltransferase